MCERKGGGWSSSGADDDDGKTLQRPLKVFLIREWASAGRPPLAPRTQSHPSGGPSLLDPPPVTHTAEGETTTILQSSLHPLIKSLRFGGEKGGGFDAKSFQKI